MHETMNYRCWCIIQGYARPEEPVLIAAIDVGSSAIRMEIAEIRPDATFRVLESLSKAVALGKDTFTGGHLSEEAMQKACWC